MENKERESAGVHKIKDAVIYPLVITASITLQYLVTAFATNEINFTEWSTEIRLVLALSVILITLVTVYTTHVIRKG